MRKIPLIVVLVIYCLFSASAQDHKVVQAKFGSGIKFTARDTSFQLKLTARIQNRYDAMIDLGDDDIQYVDRFFIRRARIKFSGFAYTPRLTYKIEVDLVNGQMLDAVVMWNFYKGFTIWFGQTKLPGNRERVLSSQNLQFVDRSQLNSNYTLDRDKGIQLRHKHKIGKAVIHEIASLSLGEGLNQTSFGNGHDYTGRIEILPFGEFIKKGDYVGADVYREPTPKLALGGTFDFNHNSMRDKGQRGEFFEVQKDLYTWFADMMFKYRGFSVMGEYAHRISEGSPVVDTTGVFNTGSGVNIQAGYICKKNWEVAGRFTSIWPEEATSLPDLKEYTVALSKYIVRHSLKIQTDFTYQKKDFIDGILIWRLQVELSF